MAAMASSVLLILGDCSATALESSERIRSTSASSAATACLSWLFSSTTAIGSMNTVAPDEDWSCTIPGACPRISAFTGTTKRPFLKLTTGS